jgi:hypothetical protein
MECVRQSKTRAEPTLPFLCKTDIFPFFAINAVSLHITSLKLNIENTQALQLKLKNEKTQRFVGLTP